MAEAVYLLCALTSLACAVLLLRGYRASRTPLLFWSCLCFVGLVVNNVLLFVDLVMVPDFDLRVLRASTALGSLALLLYGLVVAEAKVAQTAEGVPGAHLEIDPEDCCAGPDLVDRERLGGQRLRRLRLA